jgi:3-hydroxyacyl-CoA dehydrogenase
MDLKLSFYKDLASKVQPNAIFASNTSSLQITAMALASNRPSQFIGLHFFNPVQIMKLVEVISTQHTSPEVVTKVTAYCKKIGKTSVLCGDTPGFIVNRLLVPYMAQVLCILLHAFTSLTG